MAKKKYKIVETYLTNEEDSSIIVLPKTKDYLVVDKNGKPISEAYVTKEQLQDELTKVDVNNVDGGEF